MLQYLVAILGADHGGNGPTMREPTCQ